MWFSLEPIDLEHARSLPDSFENTALVKAPAARVFDCFVSDMTRWMPDVRSVTWMSPEPHGVGTHRVVRLPGLAVHEKFLAWERGRHVAFRLEAASLPLLRAMVEDLRIEPAGDGLVRVRYSVHYAPLAVARPLSPLLTPVFAKMFEDGLKALGRHAERLQSSN